MKETLAGIIERVTFHNPENGFVVLRVQAEGRREPVTVVGQVVQVAAGESFEAQGQWEEEGSHGLQFKADTLHTRPPHTCEAIEKYLASGLIKGIGPHYAHKIVAVFGDRTLQIIDESPAFLKEIKGIGSQRLQRIRASWREQKAVRELMLFLQAHGVGTSRAVRIYKTYGDRAIDMVRANPYRLASDIWGVGFQTADQLAQRLGIDRQSSLRAQAALRYVLQEISQEGHCGYPEAEVRQRTATLTGIGADIIALAVEDLLVQKEVVRETANGSWLSLQHLYQAEVEVARGLRLLQASPHPLQRFDLEAALGQIEKKLGLTLAPAQRDAIRQAATHKVLVITGGPGVGKTTIVSGIVDVFRAQNMRCALCAPTGRAAKRLTQTTSQPAKTIHRLLEIDPGRGSRYGAGNPLEVDWLLVDESSMVDVVLMHQLVRALPAGACLVLVGDVDQLPSVGPGCVLADIIASGTVPVVRLTEIFRQAGQSGIVRAAHQVNAGQLPESATPQNLGDFYVVEADNPGTICQRLVTLIRERIPLRFGLDPIEEVQVLTPMNRSELGAKQLNVQLQEVFNPGQGGPEVVRFGWTFRPGDKVLQTVNNYHKEVFNGDIGRITAIDLTEQELTVHFDGRAVIYDFGELDELALAYALTIHKSQGNEYPAVVVPLHTQHYLLLQRNVLYTAITRGKKLVVLVGSRKALALAVQRQDNSRRHTGLGRRLQEAYTARGQE